MANKIGLTNKASSIKRWKYTIIVSVTTLLQSCQPDIDKIELTLQVAGDKQEEIVSLLNHYQDGDPRKKAAEFLVEHMFDKYYMQGAVLKIYDAYFDSLKVFRERDGIVKEKGKIKKCWNQIDSLAWGAHLAQPAVSYDCQNLSARLLINHIDSVYEEWRHIPAWADTSFNTFLEYVLPYRVGNEAPELNHRIFIDRHSMTRDTAQTPYRFMRRFAGFYRNGRDRFSRILQKHPYALSLSQIERGHYGICRDNAMYCIQAMRSIGLPATKDFVHAWGNKSSDHTWGVLLLKDGGIYPFDPFKRDTVQFDYKPAKIFRTTYSTSNVEEWSKLEGEVPEHLYKSDAIDVSSQYGRTFDVKIQCAPNVNTNHHKYGIICVFSTNGWIPVWYGKFRNGTLTFNDMMGDVLYLAAFWKDGKITPCSEPFFLREDGKMEMLQPSASERITLVLKRKYPLFRATRSHARQLEGAVIEGCNSINFAHPDTLYIQNKRPVDMCDTSLNVSKHYRFIRWKDSDEHVGNLAEIEFFGKMDNDTNVVKLQGEIFGYPKALADESHSYWKAMDGDPDSYFGKDARSVGYVGIDIGTGHKARLSRIRFCPRSDTNFILQGDEYELRYWQDGNWHTFGTQMATSDSLVFTNVPYNTLYWLRDLTKGKEERPFTYENGKQVWW